jgi:hypothetical protein
LSRRPTREEVHATAELVWTLADTDQDTYYTIAFLVDAMVWVKQEADLAHKAAGYGRGTDAQIIGRHGLGRPVEDRLDLGEETGRKQRGGVMQPPVEPSDLLYKNLRALYRKWTAHLDGLYRDMYDDARDKAHWPRRSADEGDLPYAEEA